MADTPESLVFGGREGSGAAQIFGHPYDVVNMYRQGVAEQRRRGDIQAAMDVQARKDRDKKVSELLLTNPDKTFEPFKQQVVNAAEQHRTKAIGMLDKGIDPDSAHFKLWNKTGWENDVNSVANKGNLIEKVVTQKRSEVAANKYLDKDVIDSAINDTYMNDKGEGHPIESIDLKKIGDVVNNNPQAFKADVYGNDFLKDLGNTVFKYNELQRNNEGVSTEGYVEKLKKGIYQSDPNAADGILRDPKTGTPVINITPEVVQAFKADKNAANWVRYQSEKNGVPEKDVIQNVLAPKVGEDRQRTLGFKYAPQNNFNEFGIHTRDEQKATKRLQNVSTLADAFVDNEGYTSDTPNLKAQELLGYIKGNAKFGGADIVDAKFVKGDSEKGTSDGIVLTTKQGVRGRPKDVSIDLSNKKSATAELNSIMETAKTEGGFKIGHDVLRAMDEQKFENKYLQGERKIRPGSEDEKIMNRQIENWRKGEKLDSLLGKTLGGKKIIKVKPNPPALGFLGKNTIDVELSDGTTEQLNTNDTDDLKKLREIYSSGFTPKTKLAGDKGKAELEAIFQQ